MLIPWPVVVPTYQQMKVWLNSINILNFLGGYDINISEKDKKHTFYF